MTIRKRGMGNDIANYIRVRVASVGGIMLYKGNIPDNIDQPFSAFSSDLLGFFSFENMSKSSWYRNQNIIINEIQNGNLSVSQSSPSLDMIALDTGTATWFGMFPYAARNWAGSQSRATQNNNIALLVGEVSEFGGTGDLLLSSTFVDVNNPPRLLDFSINFTTPDL